MNHVVLSPSGIIFGMLLLLIGGLITRFSVKRMQEERESLSEDRYVSLPTAMGTVLTVMNDKHHWFVRFVNAEGEECLGMDDRFAESVFHIQKHHMPQRGSVERVYYWPFEESYDRNTNYCYDGLCAHYYVHFCDESLYDVSHAKQKRRGWGRLLLAAAFMVAGVLTLLFGE